MAGLITLGNLFLGGGLAVERGVYPFSSFAFFNAPPADGYHRYYLSVTETGERLATYDTRRNVQIAALENRLGRDFEAGKLATTTFGLVREFLPTQATEIYLMQSVSVGSHDAISRGARDGEATVVYRLPVSAL